MAQCQALISSKGKLKSQKMTNLVHSVPSTLEQTVKFLSKEEQKKVNYSVVALSDIDAGIN
jgi:hypothetical protein